MNRRYSLYVAYYKMTLIPVNEEPHSAVNANMRCLVCIIRGDSELSDYLPLLLEFLARMAIILMIRGVPGISKLAWCECTMELYPFKNAVTADGDSPYIQLSRITRSLVLTSCPMKMENFRRCIMAGQFCLWVIYPYIMLASFFSLEHLLDLNYFIPQLLPKSSELFERMALSRKRYFPHWNYFSFSLVTA